LYIEGQVSGEGRGRKERGDRSGLQQRSRRHEFLVFFDHGFGGLWFVHAVEQGE
jgi:hypothetical protein